MSEFIQAYLGTICILLLVIVLAGLALRSILKDKKSGKGSCGGNCSACHGSCAPGGGSCTHGSDREIRKMIAKNKRKNKS